MGTRLATMWPRFRAKQWFIWRGGHKIVLFFVRHRSLTHCHVVVVVILNICSKQQTENSKQQTECSILVRKRNFIKNKFAAAANQVDGPVFFTFLFHVGQFCWPQSPPPPPPPPSPTTPTYSHNHFRIVLTSFFFSSFLYQQCKDLDGTTGSPSFYRYKIKQKKMFKAAKFETDNEPHFVYMYCTVQFCAYM